MNRDEQLRRDLEKMETRLAYIRGVLARAAERGQPTADLCKKTDALWQETLEVLALLKGEKIYSVRLGYERIIAPTADEAFLEACRSSGDLVERTVEVQIDPAASTEELGFPDLHGKM